MNVGAKKIPEWVQYAILAGLLVMAVLAALWLLRAEPRTLFSDAPLVSTQFIPAGTLGERIELRPQRGVFRTSDHDERLVYDREYVRGRVTVVDIHPGHALLRADFEQP